MPGAGCPKWETVPETSYWGAELFSSHPTKMIKTIAMIPNELNVLPMISPFQCRPVEQQILSGALVKSEAIVG